MTNDKESTDVDSHTNLDGARSRKRRRVLACDTCRRIKSRCDYESHHGSCNRCATLRIPCSLSDTSGGSSAGSVAIVQGKANELSLLRDLHAKLAEQTALLQDLKKTVERQAPNEQPLPPTPSQIEASASQHDAENTDSPADQDTESAPVVMIRNVLRKGKGGFKRLQSQGIDGLLDLGLFSAHTAYELLDLFLARAGPWLQLTAWESIGIRSDMNQSISSNLIAACVLQGMALSDLRNSATHETFYEYVRSILAPVLLISPLPLDCLFALSISCWWCIAPVKKMEYIDSWLVSGHAVQQAMLTINFTNLRAKIKKGTSDAVDRHTLRTWNHICLSHLYFAVGTGRPSLIAESYLDQCPSILNAFEPTIQDQTVLAEIHYYSAILKLLTTALPLQADGKCKELDAWHDKWGYLLKLKTDRALASLMSYDFGYLVIAQRSLKNINAPSPTTPQSNHPVHPDTHDEVQKAFILHSITYSTAVLESLTKLEPPFAESMPNHLYLSVIYSILVLVACHSTSPDPTRTLSTIRTAMKYCKDSGIGPLAAAEYAISKLEERIQDKEQPGAETPLVYTEGNDALLTDMWSAGNPPLSFDMLQDSGFGFGGMAFPSLDELFGATFVMPEDTFAP
ncbi:hypothetical protein BP6252_04157 [Coleophoma cylindrospora]|uniref:Transcriptional activator of proteases prtT n=1 Tax=Coleophoma cylindrospora TaxID=1849047 RepID=A0A3D8RZP5_9HELO|nr:hypothetical protein BP6252_04157 [Coleophoma cylindrospora]